jgi:methionine-rich copper-binding protein CopC
MRRWSIVGALLVAALLSFAPVARAHDELVSSSPASGAQVTTSPTEVTLNFEEAPADGGPTTVTVTGPGGSHWEAGPAVIQGSKITVPVRPLGPAGQYAINYRILSDDGHPVSATITFTFAPPTSAPALTTTQPPVAATATRDSGQPPVWPWIVGAVVLVAAGVAVAARLGRKPGK